MKLEDIETKTLVAGIEPSGGTTKLTVRVVRTGAVVFSVASPSGVALDEPAFSPDGRLLAVSEEDNYDIHIVDYEKRELTWTYGTPEKGGSGPGQFNYPDDAHLLEDGTFLTADIRNCRVVIIDPATQKIVTQCSAA